MRILLTGATGFVGRPLARALFLTGHELTLLSRDAQRAEREIGVRGAYHSWEPTEGPPPAAALAGVDVVFNLMGENLGAGRWTKARKRAIYDSRVVGTRHLAEGLRATGSPLALHVNFSAIGFYPVNREERLDEAASRGEGFASDVCADWETEAAGIDADRHVVLRVATVFGANGGALEKLLPIFKAGGGGPVGSGRQMMSWIHREDLVALRLRCVDDVAMRGVYNAVAPEPVSNKAFSKTLGRVLRKPAFMPAPPPMLKLAFGEMSQLVLDGQAVVSSRLAETGFEFRYGRLEDALAEAAGVLDIGLEGERHVCDRFEDFVFIPKPREEVFPFFADPGNLERITPPLLKFEIERSSTATVTEGTVIDYRLKLHGLPLRWRSLIRTWEPEDAFVDFQLKGPYRLWNHRHTFIPVDGGTVMTDRVDYQLPLGPLGGLAASFVVRDLKKIFDHRRRTLLELLG